MAPREAELRDRVRTILAANRELGPRDEDAAVEQSVDLLEGRPAKQARPAPTPVPAARGWSTLAVLAVVAAAVIVGLPLLRLAFGVLAGVVDAFVWVLFGLACVLAIKIFKRVTRAIDRPRPYCYDAWEDERGHRWRRVF